ncbi:MAG: nucleoside deaminase [Chloroflexota bacterium]|nr:nucleoside deaminase [Chloroflexota bacterium]
MNYELYMGAALAEARAAASDGERPDGAVAVMGDAMVARAREQVHSKVDPTAHAVMVVLREASRRLGRTSLSGLTVFAAHEPCAMCVGALLESDADGLVFALADPRDGAAGSAVQLAASTSLPRRLAVVSGIMQSEAAELRAPAGGSRRG